MRTNRTSPHRDATLSKLVILSVSAILFAFPEPSEAQQRSPTIDIAKAYNLDSFGQIEAIRYTWNIDSAVIKVARSWEWNPKTDTVSYDCKDKDSKGAKATHKRSDLQSQSEAVKAQ